MARAKRHYITGIPTTTAPKKMKALYWHISSIFLCSFVLGMQGCANIEDSVKAEELYVQGSEQMADGQYEKAVNSFEQSLQQDSKSSKALAGLGWAHFSLMDLDQARKYWIKANDIKANSSAYTGIGSLSLMNNDLENAKQNFIISIQLDQNNALAHQSLGRVYDKQGNLDKAIEEFETAIELNPKDKFSYWLLSEIYKNQGSMELSEYYKRLFEN